MHVVAKWTVLIEGVYSVRTMSSGWRRPSLLPLGLVAVAAVIILAGGTIRILDAGESCPDWPKCFGTWTFDVSEEEQLQWWEDNPEATEDTRGAGHTYNELEIFSEWVHRLLVGLVAFPILLNALWMHRLRATYGARVRNVAVLAGALLVMQAGVGALTVVYDNRDWTVALHLCMATVWTSTLLHQYHAMRKIEGVSWGMFSTSGAFLAKQRRRTDAFAAAVLVLLALGAWVSSTAPGAQYNQACSIGFPDGWPACRGQLLPSVNHTGVLVQMVHRTGALVVGALLIVGAARIKTASRQAGEPLALAGAVDFVGGLWMANLLVGAGYIVFADADGFPEGLSLLHLVLGVTAAVVAISVTMMSRLVSPVDNGGESE